MIKFLLVFFVLSIEVCLFSQMTQPQEEYNILFLSLTGKNSRWLDDAIADTALKLRRVESEKYISCRLQYDELRDKDSKEKFLKSLKKDMEITNYDIIVALSLESADIIVNASEELNLNIPILILNDNENYEALAQKYPKLIVLEQESELMRTMEMATGVLPQFNDIIVALGYNESGRAEKELNNTINEKYPNKNITVIKDNSCTNAEILPIISNATTTPIVIISNWQPKTDDNIDTRKLFNMIKETRNVPIFSTKNSELYHGQTGGFLLNSAQLSERIYNKIIALIDEDNSTAFSDESENSVPIADYLELQKFNANMTALPRGTIILNRPPPSPFPHLFMYFSITTAVIAVMLIIIFILFYSMKKSKRINTIFSLLPLRIALIDREGNILFIQKGKKDQVYSCPPSQIRHLRDLPSEIHTAFSEMTQNALESKESVKKINYLHNGVPRRAVFTRLPSGIFGMESLLWYSEDISELHRSMEEKNMMTEHLRCTLESISDAVMTVDTNGKITLCNKAASKIIGLKENELIGADIKTFSIQLKTAGQDIIKSPSERAIMEKRTIRIPRGSIFAGVDGKYTIISGTAAPLTDKNNKVFGAVVAAHNVTKEVKNEHELQNTNKLLSAILDHIPCSIFIKDYSDSNRYIIVNRYFCDRIGVNPDDVIGKTDYEIFPTEEVARYIRNDHRAMEHNTLEIFDEHFSTRNDGELFMHTIKNKIVLPDGRLLLLGLSLDITTQRKLEMELRKNLEMLNCLVNNCPAGISVKDPQNEFRYTAWNKANEQITGLGAEDVFGKNDREIGMLQSDNLQMQEQYDKEVYESGKIATFRSTGIQKNGIFHEYKMTKVLAKVDMHHSYILTLSLNVTDESSTNVERERTLKILKNYAETKHIINNCLAALSAGLDYNLTLPRILENIAEPCEADYCCVHKYVSNGQNVIVESRWISDMLAATHFPLVAETATKDTLFQHCFNRNELFKIVDFAAQDIALSPSLKQAYRHLGFKSMIAAPIFLNGDLWGAISIGFVKNHRNFSTQDERIILAAADIVALTAARKNQLDKLFCSEREKSLILNNIKIPITLYDCTGKIVTVNEATVELRNTPARVITATPCYKTLCHEDGFPEDCPVMNVIKTGKPATRTYRVNEKVYVVNYTPVTNSRNELIHVLASAHDVTLKEQAHEQLIKSKAAAETADRAKGEFIAAISHEIKTPLNTIIGLSEVLGMEDMSLELKERVMEINEAGQSLLAVIDGVIEASGNNTEEEAIEFDWMNAANLLNSICRTLRPSAEKKKLKLQEKFPVDIPEIYFPADKMRQFLLAICENAIKFTKKGGVTLSLEFTGGNEETLNIAFIISDTGIGIDDQDQKRIFMPFEQINPPVRGTRTIAGAGVGLSVAKNLIKKLHGTISLKSKKGCGTTVTINFNNIKWRENKKVISTRHLHGYAWVIDDVELNSKVLARMLNKLGFECRCIANQEELHRMLKRDTLPDILFSDIWMPELNGVELAKFIRSKPRTAALPIIAVTADSDPYISFDMSAFSGVLLKPLTMEKLREILSHPLEVGNGKTI